MKNRFKVLIGLVLTSLFFGLPSSQAANSSVQKATPEQLDRLYIKNIRVEEVIKGKENCISISTELEAEGAQQVRLRLSGYLDLFRNDIQKVYTEFILCGVYNTDKGLLLFTQKENQILAAGRFPYFGKELFSIGHIDENGLFKFDDNISIIRSHISRYRRDFIKRLLGVDKYEDTDRLTVWIAID